MYYREEDEQKVHSHGRMSSTCRVHCAIAILLNLGFVAAWSWFISAHIEDELPWNEIKCYAFYCIVLDQLTLYFLLAYVRQLCMVVAAACFYSLTFSWSIMILITLNAANWQAPPDNAFFGTGNVNRNTLEWINVFAGIGVVHAVYSLIFLFYYRKYDQARSSSSSSSSSSSFATNTYYSAAIFESSNGRIGGQ